MARQQDLIRIGVEGFDVIDKFYPPTRRTTTTNNGHGGFTAKQRPQGRYWGVQASPDHKKEEPVINSNDAASRFGGVSVLNYPKTKPKYFWGKIFFKA